jgi:hypothetical protein
VVGSAAGATDNYPTARCIYRPIQSLLSIAVARIDAVEQELRGGMMARLRGRWLATDGVRIAAEADKLGNVIGRFANLDPPQQDSVDPAKPVGA